MPIDSIFRLRQLKKPRRMNTPTGLLGRTSLFHWLAASMLPRGGFDGRGDYSEPPELRKGGVDFAPETNPNNSFALL
jgi:hypothetical protein